jgi:hypothetical protein
MDTLYYSNYCKHSQRVLQFLVKGNLADKINFLCIDNREKNPTNNQLYIVLENGKKVTMPPNIQSVPSLLLVRQGYRVILGDDIIRHYQVDANLQTKKKISNQIIEPIGTGLLPSSGGMNILSEPYTPYDLTPDELSAKGNSDRRSLHNYVSANDDIISIQTPPDTYQPDKVDKAVTIDTLQQKRFDDIDNKPSTVFSSI